MDEVKNLFNKINDYYDQSLEDYKLIWHSGKNYALHAGYYDSKHTTHDAALLNMNRFVAKVAKIKQNDKVLDAGCGMGGTSIWIAKHFKARVTGININKNQIEMAKTIASKENVSDIVDFKMLDYHDSRLKANSYDSIVAIESICHSEDKPRFMSEAHRLLKKGGTLVITDGFRSKSQNPISDETKLKKWLNGWAVKDLASVDEFKNYLFKSRFKRVKVVDITEHVMKSSFRLYLASIINYPIAKCMEFLGLRTKVQTDNLIGAYYQHITLKQGLWKYCIFYAEK